ncbi:MAG: protein-glutamate O-methyltransferase CheR [Deltaproteobacteria bacterium]|nr:protein-glutamate O-methyltransferase CheR [Deltaproteobacteria bacterium]
MKLNTKTDHGWSKATLDEVLELIRKAHGRDIHLFDENFLANSLEKRLTATSTATLPAYAERLGRDPAEAEAFYRSLRITYSEFFRNPLAFALLEQPILPGIVEEKARNSRSELRVWSAGCATGQEAWSVAILLEELTTTREHPVPFRIFATDVSEANLTLAREGIYSAESVGNVRLRHLREYFSRQGDFFAIAPRIRTRVDFSAHDLLDECTTCPPASIYGHFDLVLCGNVLLYYRPETQRLILNKLRRCLVTGGYLMTGETERHIVENAGGFRAVAPPTSIFQRVRQKEGE